MIKQICPVLFFIILFSCSTPDHLTPEELNKYILDADHGLVQKNEVNDYVAEVIYRPTDLLVHQELGDDATDEAAIAKLRAKYDPYYYFILNLSRNNKEALHQVDDMGQYSELVQTLAFGMAQYTNLTASQDTIPTADFMLNRTYGLSDATSLLFVFNKEKAKDKNWVQFNLNEFGLGIGNQRFRFKTKDLENTPKIEFNLSGKPDK